MTPNGFKTYPIQKAQFDLDSFQEVIVGKEYQYEPIQGATPAEVTANILAKVGNDVAKLRKVVDDGLRAEIHRQHAADPSGWFTFDEDDKLTDEPYNGTLLVTVADADGKVIFDAKKEFDGLVLKLAKTAFGFSKDATAEVKNAAKDTARGFIKSNQVILDGLKKRMTEALASVSAS